MKKMYGVTVAMVTPFTDMDQVDTDYLTRYSEYLIQAGGVHCLYPCGTTGEMLKMSVDERMLVAKTVIDVAAGRLPVFIHVGASTTRETMLLARHALKNGADGIGVVSPQFFLVLMTGRWRSISLRLQIHFPQIFLSTSIAFPPNAPLTI